MSVKKDGSGRRLVRVETEVPGTPEEVWRAIATGPGIGSWFVPTTIETDEHGRPVRAVSDFGPGMESVATITEWNPPHHFAAGSADLGPDAPPIATEWIVVNGSHDSSRRMPPQEPAGRHDSARADFAVRMLNRRADGPDSDA